MTPISFVTEIGTHVITLSTKKRTTAFLFLLYTEVLCAYVVVREGYCSMV